jgi:hypothetical protein
MTVLSAMQDTAPDIHSDDLLLSEIMSIVLHGHGEVRVAAEPGPREYQRLPPSFYLLSEKPSVRAFLELGDRILAWLHPSTMRFRNQEMTTPHGVRCRLRWDVCLDRGHWFSIWGVTPQQYRSLPLPAGTLST